MRGSDARTDELFSYVGLEERVPAKTIGGFARPMLRGARHADRCRRRWAGHRTCAHRARRMGPHQRPTCRPDQHFPRNAEYVLDRLPEGHRERAKDQDVYGLATSRGRRGRTPSKDRYSDEETALVGQTEIDRRVCHVEDDGNVIAETGATPILERPNDQSIYPREPL